MTATVPVPRLVWYCLACRRSNDMLRHECRYCGGHRPCEFFERAVGPCEATPVRPYVVGPRCDRHKP